MFDPLDGDQFAPELEPACGLCKRVLDQADDPWSGSGRNGDCRGCRTMIAAGVEATEAHHVAGAQDRQRERGRAWREAAARPATPALPPRRDAAHTAPLEPTPPKQGDLF